MTQKVMEQAASHTSTVQMIQHSDSGRRARAGAGAAVSTWVRSAANRSLRAPTTWPPSPSGALTPCSMCVKRPLYLCWTLARSHTSAQAQLLAPAGAWTSCDIARTCCNETANLHLST